MSDAATSRPMMPGRFGLAILLVALIQSAVLCWMIYDRVSLIGSGREIVLDTVPVDPRSLFRGDYVILNYGISRLDTRKLGGDDSFERGDTVYVTLLKDESDLWQGKAIGRTSPETVAGDEIVMRGRVTYSGASKDRKSVV